VGPERRDLASGEPDPELLPSLSGPLARVAATRGAGGGRPEADLIGLARASFAADGIDAPALAVVSGALDGIERVLGAHLRPGDGVIVEDPVYPPVRDLLLALGLVAKPVPVDDHGLLPGELGRALRPGVRAMIAVPRAQNPFGSALAPERAEELRRVLARRRDVLIVEDDHAWPVAGAPLQTHVVPEWPSWAAVRSVSKVLHPDLRVALMAGDPRTIALVEGRQALGPRWVSPILQALTAELLSDPSFEPTVTRACEAYDARRDLLLRALGDRGIAAHGRSGLNVWVPVREEAPVMQALYDAGWAVLAGEHFRLASSPAVRITIATLTPGEAQEVADVVASVEQASRRRRAY
jgi:DNA-binding transcriptional MocR family regulator